MPACYPQQGPLSPKVDIQITRISKTDSPLTAEAVRKQPIRHCKRSEGIHKTLIQLYCFFHTASTKSRQCGNLTNGVAYTRIE